jgi:aminoglycoside phosphotransferase family enzyme/predicted kinase
VSVAEEQQESMQVDRERTEPSRLPPFIRAMLRREAFPHPADDLQVHETHISWVILAGPYAYKMKKHVNFGFLDFSSLEQRRADCEAEVRLNRRLCPDVYRGVVNVVERDGTYRIGGLGHVVEPAVWMRRLPEEGMLPHLLARDAVDAVLVRRIARLLARFHAQAATGAGVDEWGTIAAVRANWEENFAQSTPYIGRTISTAFQGHIAAFVAEALTMQASLFVERVASGRIRDGHGDLHSANICVEGRRLHLFDCLEFSQRYRCADVAAEVAFLAMDLDRYGRADLAAAFIDAYVDASGDRQLLDLLPFYRSYRAWVRGKVLSLGLDDPALAPDARAEMKRQARRYFDLAWSHAGGIAHPLLIVSMGMPATGKTTLAHALATRLGLVHLSSDRVRKELAGVAPTARHTGAYNTGIYRPQMTSRTYATLHRRAGRWLRHGQSVVLDASYGNPAERVAAQRLARRTGVPLVVFVCEADEATIRQRLAARASDAAAVSDARLTNWPALRDAFSDPDELRDAVRLDMTHNEADVLDRALRHLAIGGYDAACG